MRKCDFFLFLSFAAIFVLFACFQNFSFVDDIPAEAKKVATEVKTKVKSISFCRPYFFKEKIGSLETPIGFTKSIAPADGPKIFDHKKYLQDMMNNAPAYKDLKEYVDFSDRSSPSSTCVQDPTAKYNNCYVEYDSLQPSHPGMKFKTNPLRKTASVTYGGEIDSELYYDHGANLEFTRPLNSNSALKLEFKQQDQYGGASGMVNIDVKW